MLAFVTILLCLSGVVLSDTGVNWALLVAGSNGYYNYRHQADVCHAYQIMHKYGIPDERIVVMMYDDIANDPSNPTKGVLINKPDGEDVYKGTLKDYTGNDVTPQNFLKILQGKSMDGIGSGKTIASGPNDNVFVFFSDHGAPGLIAFPNDVLGAKDLNTAIQQKHIDNQFKKMVLYIEACNSGSMFDGILPNNINVYATTASNGDESSYACYYDDVRETYLGDLYSVTWMEDSDLGKLWSETLNQQFVTVRELTNLSHVMEFGDMSMVNDVIGLYQGEKASSKPIESIKATPASVRIKDAVRTEDVRIAVLSQRLAKEVDEAKKADLHKQIAHGHRMKRVAVGVISEIAATLLKGQSKAFSEVMSMQRKLVDHDCYMSAVNHLIEKCFSMNNEYALRKLYVLVNLCERGVAAENIHMAIDGACPKRFEF